MTLRRLRPDVLVLVLACASAYLAAAPSPAGQPTGRIDVSATASTAQPSGAPPAGTGAPSASSPLGPESGPLAGDHPVSGHGHASRARALRPSSAATLALVVALVGWPVPTFAGFDMAGTVAATSKPSGVASWYRDPRKTGHYAAMPAYRWGMTPWRVRVCSARACVVARVSDHCGCYVGTRRARAIDLSPTAFARLAPLGRGLVRVTIRRLP